MPFTPYHLGPAMAVGLPLRKYLHIPTFILGNLVLDLEGASVIFLGLNYPLHGYLHTVLFGVVVGLLLGLAMFALGKPMGPFYRKIQLETSKSLKLPSFLLAGVLGSLLHVLFDAFLYSEMQPFFPLTLNPLLNFGVPMSSVYSFCFWLSIIGLVFYVVLFAYSFINHKKNKIYLYKAKKNYYHYTL